MGNYSLIPTGDHQKMVQDICLRVFPAEGKGLCHSLVEGCMKRETVRLFPSITSLPTRASVKTLKQRGTGLPTASYQAWTESVREQDHGWGISRSIFWAHTTTLCCSSEQRVLLHPSGFAPALFSVRPSSSSTTHHTWLDVLKFFQGIKV